jgi:excisionase family DNA binding protein
MKGLSASRNSKPRHLSVSLKDLPRVFTDPSVPLAAPRGVGNRRRVRFSTESGGSMGELDQPATAPVSNAPLLLDCREVEHLLGIGRTKVYELMARKQIPVVRIGRCVRVPRDELEAWIASRTSVRDFQDVPKPGSW